MMPGRIHTKALFIVAICMLTFNVAVRSDSNSAADLDDLSKQKGMVRLSPKSEVWIDVEKRRVIVGGRICLRKGLLEMFACPQGTKEHESIVAVKSKAYVVHTALLAVGGKSGTPVQYQPEYVPASGATVQVDVVWKGEDGKQKKRSAQQMIRHIKTRQPMKLDWVFAGSGFWEDEATGKRIYQAEGGELICLSNFSTAMLDLPVESTQANSELLFEALTDNIPPLGTDVHLILTPKPEAGDDQKKVE